MSEGERKPPGKGFNRKKGGLPGVLKSPILHLDKRVTMPDYSGKLYGRIIGKGRGVFATPTMNEPPRSGAS